MFEATIDSYNDPTSKTDDAAPKPDPDADDPADTPVTVNVTMFTGDEFDLALPVQNELRAQHGLPALSDPRDVPAVVVPQAGGVHGDFEGEDDTAEGGAIDDDEPAPEA